jgi:hypothetical protein
MSRFLKRIKLVLDKHTRSEGMELEARMVKRLRTGYYEVINKRGLLQGFIEKKYKRWNLSMYGVPTKTYPSFKEAKEAALKSIK